MEKSTMETADVLNALIDGEKMMANIMGLHTQSDDFTLFSNGVTHLYNYIKGHLEPGDGFYPKSKFTEMFERAVVSNTELPDDICAWAECYYEGFQYEDVSTETFDRIKDRVIKQGFAKMIHDISAANQDVDTAEVRNLIFNYCHAPGCMALVSPLYQWARRNARLDCRFVSAIFEYGYIMGKRAERAKRKGRTHTHI